MRSVFGVNVANLSVGFIREGYADLGMTVDESLHATVKSSVDCALQLAEKCRGNDPKYGSLYVFMVRCLHRLPSGSKLVKTEPVRDMLDTYAKAAAAYKPQS